jgi:hypothetical protein
MTIVTARPPRKRSRPAQPAEIDAPRIVQHPPKWQRDRKPVPPGAEAEAQVIAFFRRMGLNVPNDIFEP